MAKVRFYCDVPEYSSPDYAVWARSQPLSHTLPPGFKRIAFDVDMPPGVCKPFDIPAQASNAHIVIDETEDSDHAR